MDDAEVLASPAEIAAAGGRRRRSSRRTTVRALAVIVAVALVGGAGWTVRWWTHPDLFGAGATGMTQVMPDLPLARSGVTVAVTFPSQAPHTTVVFRGAPRLTFLADSAGVTARFWICHPRDRTELMTSSHGMGRRFCRTLTPVVAGTRLTGGHGDYLLARLRPTRPGRYLMSGADLDYRTDAAHGWRRGVDHVAAYVTGQVT